MNPKTLADTSIGMSAGGTGFSLFGDLLKGMSSANMYNYQGGIASMRAKFAEQNADYAIMAGEKEGQRYGMKAGFTGAKIKVAQAASNIDVGRGSHVDVQRGHQKVTGMDLEQIGENAARRAYGFQVEAAGERAKAKAYDMAADNSMLSTIFNMGSTLMTGGTSVASKWMQAKQLGIYGGGANSFYAPDDL